MKPTLKPCDIVFTMQHDSWIARAIAWFMKSKWSHSMMIVDRTDARTYVTETSSFETVVSVMDYYFREFEKTVAVYRPKCHVPQDAMVNECLDRLFVTYGYLQLISFGIKRLLARINITIPNFFRQGVVCNGHVMYAYTKSGIAGLHDVDPESIDTEEFFQIVSNSPDFELVYFKPKGKVDL